MLESTSSSAHGAARGLISRSLSKGSLTGLVTTAAVVLSGIRQARSGVAPVNATSHVLWGDEAATADRVDLKHTLPGTVINGGAGVFWAVVHELLLRRTGRNDPAAAAGAAAAVAALAYVVDYHLIPRRLSPGWELRIPRRSVAFGFVALGVGLAVAGLFQARRR